MPTHLCKSLPTLAYGLLLVTLLACSVQPGMAEEIGVFFDAQGQSCVGEIRPFGQADVYVLAFLSQEVDFNGALLSLKLPGSLSIVGGTAGIVWPKGTQQSGDLLADTGINLQFERCPRRSGVVELFHMTLEDLSFGQDPRPNLLVQIGGGVSPVDSTLKLQPQVKICEDGDPGGFGRLVPATPLRATLNCTEDCPCSVTVQTNTWSAVKRRFREE